MACDDDETSYLKPVGLNSLIGEKFGSSLNCFLQTLFLIPKIRFLILNSTFNETQRAASETQKLFCILHKERGISFSTKSIEKSFDWHDDDFLYEHDVIEFYHLVFDKIETDNFFKNDIYLKKLRNLLKIKYKIVQNNIETEVCDYAIEIDDNFNPFIFNSNDFIDEDECSYNGDVIVINDDIYEAKKIKIDYSPKIIRFNVKTNKNYDFLKGFTISEIFKTKNNNTSYEIIGLILKNKYDGHHILFFKFKEWFLIDDENIIKVSENFVMDQKNSDFLVSMLIYAKTKTKHNLFKDKFNIPKNLEKYYDDYKLFIKEQLDQKELMKINIIYEKEIIYSVFKGKLNLSDINSKYRIILPYNSNSKYIYNSVARIFNLDSSQITLLEIRNNEISNKLINSEDIYPKVDKLYVHHTVRQCDDFCLFVCFYSNIQYPPLQFHSLIFLSNDETFNDIIKNNIQTKEINSNFRIFLKCHDNFELIEPSCNIKMSCHNGSFVIIEQSNKIQPNSFSNIVLKLSNPNEFNYIDNYLKKFPNDFEKYMNLRKTLTSIKISYNMKEYKLIYPKDISVLDFKQFTAYSIGLHSFSYIFDLLIFYDMNSGETILNDNKRMMNEYNFDDSTSIIIKTFKSVNLLTLNSTKMLKIRINDDDPIIYTFPCNYLIEDVLTFAISKNWIQGDNFKAFILNDDIINEVHYSKSINDINSTILITNLL